MITPTTQPPFDKVNGPFYDMDLFNAYLTPEELTQRFGLIWTEGEEDGLGRVDIGWINFNGHIVRLLRYKDGPEEFAKQICFAFPNKTPGLGKLKDELTKELGISPSWVTSLI